MSHISSYLTFNGNCREAMQFYQKCLGGRLRLQTVGQSPLSAGLPEHMKRSILQALLIKGDLLLAGSDMVDDRGLVKGNAVSLLLHCASARELKRCFSKLAEGGQPGQTPGNISDNAITANLVDRYGNHWVLHYPGHVSEYGRSI